MFGRLWNLVRGFFGLFVSGLEKANPRAMLEAEVLAFQEAVGQYNTNLAKQAGMVERLREQIKRQKKELDNLTARVTANYAAKNMEEAGRAALAAKQLKSDLTENEAQLVSADEMYRNLNRQRDVYVKEAQRRIEAIKQKLSKAEMAESQAKLAEIASATAFNLSGTGANLERLESNLDERIADASGKARVAQDSMKSGGWVMKEEEQKALEAQALNEFAASMGLPGAKVTEPAAAAEPKDMGPTEGVKA
ncbi:MAG: PspA/IM30 family protein [Planctomycetes bacterium]|nr:PspA/IM30 family protein [Planctomycetota bacterium]